MAGPCEGVCALNRSTRDSYTRCHGHADIACLRVLPVCQCCVAWFRHHGGYPGSWLHKGDREEMVGSQVIDFYELSCGSFRKQTRNL